MNNNNKDCDSEWSEGCSKVLNFLISRCFATKRYLSWNVANHQLPSLHAYSEAIMTFPPSLDTESTSLITNNDADPFAESEDEEELEDNETVLEDC